MFASIAGEQEQSNSDYICTYMYTYSANIIMCKGSVSEIVSVVYLELHKVLWYVTAAVTQTLSFIWNTGVVTVQEFLFYCFNEDVITTVVSAHYNVYIHSSQGGHLTRYTVTSNIPNCIPIVALKL